MSVILFFSNNCPHSLKFIEILKKSGEESSFSKFVCVDKVRGQRPREVSSYGILEVPTVVVGTVKRVGADAFQWLAGILDQPSPKPPQKTPSKPSTKVLSGLQSGSMFDQYETIVGLGVNNSIFGDSPVPPEGKLEKEDFFIMADDNLAGKSTVSSGKETNSSPSQLDKDYAKFLEERNNLG